MKPATAPTDERTRQPRETFQFIWNAHAGSAASHEMLRQRLTERSDCQVHIPRSAEDARQIAGQCARDGAGVVVACGGDGTVNDIAQAVFAAGTDTSLGILPLGTGNDFCRCVDIPLDPEAAADVLLRRRTVRMDLIRAETPSATTHYLNMATGGNTGRYAGRITDEMKSAWGPFVYLRGAVDVLSDLVEFNTQLTIDDSEPIRASVHNIFVANGRTSGGGVAVAPDARPDDGLLDLIIVCECDALDIAAIASMYVLADYREHPAIIHHQAQCVRVESRPDIAFSADGDVLTQDPITFTVVPRALPVIVGSGFDACLGSA